MLQMKFTYKEAHTAGVYCRELSHHILDLYRYGNLFRQINRDTTPITTKVRDMNAAAFHANASRAFKLRRERNMILRKMGRQPGFRTGYQEAKR